MVITVKFTEHFEKFLRKVKTVSLKERINKQIDKITENPELGKPMMYDRKNTRELYVSPHRISYAYVKEIELLIFLDIYHKDEQ